VIEQGLLVLPMVRLTGMIPNVRTFARFVIADSITEMCAEVVGTFSVNRHNKFHIPVIH
jgi:hypothetical protein